MIILIFSQSIYISADDIKHITDYSERLPDIEITRLENLLEESSENTGFNISVVITDDLGGKNTSEYAEDFFVDNYRDYPKSVILIINFDTNNDMIYTGISAEKYFTDDVKKKILSETVSPNIADNHISDAITGFIESSEIIFSTVIEESSETEPVENEEHSSSYSIILIVFCGIIAGGIVGVLIGFYIKLRYKRPEHDFSVSNYKCTHKQEFDIREDKFKREFVNKSDISTET